MSKLKLSVSTAMMLVIFGLFSIVAFAAAPDAPTGLTSRLLDGSKMEIKWNPVAGANSYNVYLNNSTTPQNVTEAILRDTGVLKNGDNKIEVTAVAGGEESEKASITVKMMSNGSVKNDGTVGTHKTHGDYQNNTNACANCHSTHNGSNIKLIKFQTGEYDMCLSCHDGTLGFYNVNAASGAGIMNSTHESASMHNVSSNIEVSAAPGAYKNKSTSELECSSCHNPHGSVNDRLLKEQIADINTGTVGWAVDPTAKTPIALKTKTINLEFIPNDAYSEFNASSGTGMKITTSKGPKGNTDKQYYSQFCSACHDDYLGTRDTKDPVYPGRNSNKDKAANNTNHDFIYTHTTNSTSAGRNCYSCHYAHGTDITLLTDAKGNTIADLTTKQGWSPSQAEAYMKDARAALPGGTSALKKYTNMAVCFTCHASKIGADATGLVRPGK